MLGPMRHTAHGDLEDVEIVHGAEAQPYVRQVWPSPGSYL
jgi:hypothetical protein